MNVKLFEIRDRATYIPVFAFRAQPSSMFHAQRGESPEAERYLLSRAGFSPRGDSDCIIMGVLNCNSPEASHCTYDPYVHDNRTFRVAHEHIERHFDELPSGAVIDVEYLLNETPEPKISERLTSV